MTKFLVLAVTSAPENSTVDHWKEVATIEAGSKEQALRSVGGTGTFVAVPARSWQPVRLEVEQVERVLISPTTKTEVAA